MTEPPTMTWKSDAADTETGIATFTAGGMKHSAPFNSFSDAFSLHRLMINAHFVGQKGGQRALAQLVHGAVEPYR